jgi:2-oxoglutarate dehydrogenase E2 component (dihydrolipoamide succinyltransferase)
MTVEVSVPELPESVTDATVVAWRKREGDPVKRDEALVDLETDKVVLEVPSPVDGVVEKIHQAEGDVVNAGQLLAVLKSIDAGKMKSDVVNPASSLKSSQGAADRVITASAKKMIIENGLNADEILGSGKTGRVLKEDVISFIENQKKPKADVSTNIESKQKEINLIPPSEDGGRIEKRVPMTRLRARVAERLLEAQQSAAILTTFNEVNMQPVMDLRNKYKDLFLKKHGVKLGFMSFFVKASIEALKRFPAVNASIDGNDIVYHGFFDVGVAIAAPRGLVVPVLRNADQMSLADIERNISEYVDKAKNNQLGIDDMTGGTFSLTNGGVFGSMMSTPIINPPQSGILGMHKIQPRAVVEDGEIVARPMMYLALSYDHRIIDGAEAVQFLVAIKDVLEDPARMVMGV